MAKNATNFYLFYLLRYVISVIDLLGRYFTNNDVIPVLCR